MSQPKQNPAAGHQPGRDSKEQSSLIGSKTSLNNNMEPHAQQLKALGYTAEDTVYYRAIYSTKGKGARKIEGKGFAAPAALQNASDVGYNLYLVVNGGGHADADVTHGRATFYEHDDLTKELQTDLWKSLGLPEPTIQVDTGGKSIHSYWVFDTPCPIGDWKSLQSDLLEFSNADRSTKNPSRLMRLAGYKHHGTGQLAKVISQSGHRYSFDQLRGLVPTPVKSIAVSPQPQKPIANLSTGGGDLVSVLADAIGRLSPEQLFNDPAHKWHSVSADKMQGFCPFASHGNSLSEQSGTAAWTARTADGATYVYHCPQCTDNKSINPVEYRNAIAKGDASAGTPRGRDFVEIATQLIEDAGLQVPATTGQQQQPASSAKGNPKPQSNVVPIKRDDAPQVSYETAIRELAANPPAEYADLNFRWDEIAKKYTKNTLDVSKAYHAVAKQNTEREELSEAKGEIQRYLDLGKATIDLPQLVGAPLAEALNYKAMLLGADPAVMVNQMLSVCATLAHLNTTVDLGSYNARLIHWSVAIAASGTNKSGTQYSMVAPLYKMQCEADERYQLEKKAYDREFRAWQKNKDGRDEPEEPKAARVYVLDSATTEGIRSTQCQQPHHGFLLEIDEGTAFFKSFDQYRNGKGGDKEFYLKLHNGFGFSGTTKKHGKESCPQSGVSILLNTQPSAMQAQFGDFSDGEGMMSRFNPISQDYRRRPRLGSTGKYEIGDWLYSIYDRLSLQPARTYKMDPQGFELYAQYVEGLRDQLERETEDAMRSVLSKSERSTGVIICLLHQIQAASQGLDPAQDIAIDTVQAGIAYAEYLSGQVKMMRRLAKESAGDMDAVLSKVLETAQRQGGKLTWVEAKSIRALQVEKFGTREKVKPNRQQVEKVFNQLVEAGFGSIEGEGGKMRFVVGENQGQGDPSVISIERTYTDEDLAS
jgi:Protein of unknown function (DUF3987)